MRVLLLVIILDDQRIMMDHRSSFQRWDRHTPQKVDGTATAL